MSELNEMMAIAKIEALADALAIKICESLEGDDQGVVVVIALAKVLGAQIADVPENALRDKVRAIGMSWIDKTMEDVLKDGYGGKGTILP
jgi:hypothetical protein